MTSRDFCYWLQGFFEVAGACGGVGKPDDAGLNGAQVAMIQRHLSMVFVHEIDPSFPTDQQGALNAAHAGQPSTPPAPPPPKIGGTDANGNVMRC